MLSRSLRKNLFVLVLVLVSRSPSLRAADNSKFDILEIELPRIMEKAAKYLSEPPVTVTAAHSDRSAGGLHDFFSEGDYWWPDPQNPNGPYIQHDGLTNTNNFVEHRHAMIRLSEIVATMTSAYILTSDEKYAKHAVKHLKAWFVDADTKMNPNPREFSHVVGNVTHCGSYSGYEGIHAG